MFNRIKSNFSFNPIRAMKAHPGKTLGILAGVGIGGAAWQRYSYNQGYRERLGSGGFSPSQIEDLVTNRHKLPGRRGAYARHKDIGYQTQAGSSHATGAAWVDSHMVYPDVQKKA